MRFASCSTSKSTLRLLSIDINQSINQAVEIGAAIPYHAMPANAISTSQIQSSSPHAQSSICTPYNLLASKIELDLRERARERPPLLWLRITIITIFARSRSRLLPPLPMSDSDLLTSPRASEAPASTTATTDDSTNAGATSPRPADSPRSPSQDSSAAAASSTTSSALDTSPTSSSTATSVATSASSTTRTGDLFDKRQQKLELQAQIELIKSETKFLERDTSVVKERMQQLMQGTTDRPARALPAPVHPTSHTTHSPRLIVVCSTHRISHRQTRP